MTSPAFPVSRRLLLAGSLSTVLLGGLAACGDSEAPGASEESRPPAFPTTIAHMYGSTTVKTQPKRIVVVGYTEQDALLALGAAPIATTMWFGTAPYEVYPWAKDKLGDAKPTVLDSADGLPMEVITKLQPDLILGINAPLTQEDYDELTKLAPTIASSGYFGNGGYEPWPTQTQMIGQAVGKSDEAQRLVEDLTQRFADARVAHPQFEGTTAALADASYTDGSVTALPDGLATDFLTDLGFVIPESLNKFASEDVAQAQIPAKDAKVLNDATVLIWSTETAGDGTDIENDKVLGKLDAVKEGRSIYAGDQLTSAIYFSSILSLPYVLDELVPQLERVLPDR